MLVLLLLLLLLFRLGLRLVCIILALILLPLHHVVDSIPGESGLRPTLFTVPGVGRSNNGLRPNHDARLYVGRIKEWRRGDKGAGS